MENVPITIPLLGHTSISLRRQSSLQRAGDGLEPPIHTRLYAASRAVTAPSKGWRYSSHLFTILSLLRPYAVLFLCLLAIAESLVVAAVGRIAGSFYRLVVDADHGQLYAMMMHAAGLYVAYTAISTAGTWLAGMLALKWRQTLTLKLHDRYCSGESILNLHQHQASNALPKAAIDNPDQRMTADTAALCDGLSQVARLVAAAPFKLVYYSWLTWAHVGWKGVVAVYCFFLLAAAIQRLIATPLSKTVFLQERREGDLRFAHLRLREYSKEVAAYKGHVAEHESLNLALATALDNQKTLVHRRTALAATTKLADYSGALLNYGIVAAAAFGAGATGPEVLDLADQWAVVAALARRVGEMLEMSNTKSGGNNDAEVHERTALLAGGNRSILGDQEQELKRSEFATLVHPPVEASFCNGSTMEVSIHALGKDLLREAAAIFPGAPAGGQHLYACTTFQFAAGGLSLAPNRSMPTLEKAAKEMDRMLAVFLSVERVVRETLVVQGYWVDAIDPKSGLALSGRKGGRWSEVAAAHALLGYERRDAGICPIIVHPVHGTSAYPATLFTTAPPSALQAALCAASDSPIPWFHVVDDHTPPLLALSNTRLMTPGGMTLVASSLSLAVYFGQHLLVTGPNGVGKSILLRAIWGLDALAAGTATLLQPAMFVPQRQLTAPGLTLWQQVVYPRTDRPSDAHLHALLQAVELLNLLDRTGGSFDSPQPWSELSPGEQQRLAFARVLHHKPALVLLDETTSAVSVEAAQQLYGALHNAGITTVSVGQDTAPLRAVHRVHLRLLGGGEGQWSLAKIER